MKRIMTAIFLFALSLLLSAASLFLTGSISETVSGQAEELELMLSQESPQAQDAFDALEEQWEKDYKILSTYVIHQHLEETEKNVALLGKYIRMGNYRGAEALCSQIAQSIRHIYVSEKPELQNIF